MNEIVKQCLYSARWAITQAIEYGNMEKLDYAADKILQAKSIYIEPIEPDRPSDPPPVEHKYEMPKFVVVPGVKVKTHGHYRTNTGNAKGLVVHYTVSGGTVSSAKGVLSYLARKGLGCPVMGHDGTIYIPEGFDVLKDVAWHAGNSSWKGVSGLSRYCIGIEICSWGRLDKDTKPRAANIRTSKGEDNIVEGEYEAFTAKQEESLKNLVLWLADVNPEFDIEWLCSHDEISPGRKFDCGASLSSSMPQFRATMKALLS